MKRSTFSTCLATYLTFEFPVSDLRHPSQRSVGGHDSQREAAALVSEDFRRLPKHTLRELLHQLEGWQAVQRRHSQTLVSGGFTGNLFARLFVFTFFIHHPHLLLFCPWRKDRCYYRAYQASRLGIPVRGVGLD